MRILVAFDKFKGALTAPEACDVAAAALRGRFPDAAIDLCPLTDGGDGFAGILTRVTGGRIHEQSVTGPRRSPVAAGWGLIDGRRVPVRARERLGLAENCGRIALVEMATASGLALLAPEELDPWEATSAGTGELLAAAARSGAEAILLGIGGSATNDLGVGALGALGWSFLDREGSAVPAPVPARFGRICRIQAPATAPFPPVRIACDVSNPLLGSEGATAVYGPQKGLRAEDFPRLEEELSRMAELFCKELGRSRALLNAPGAGAAGGLGFGLMAALDAELLSGSALIADWLELDRRVAAADLILTGEGRFDASSLAGKGPGAVIERALAQGKPIHVFAGQVAPLTGLSPFLALHAVTPADVSASEALPRSAKFLSAKVTETFS